MVNYYIGKTCVECWLVRCGVLRSLRPEGRHQGDRGLREGGDEHLTQQHLRVLRERGHRRLALLRDEVPLSKSSYLFL